MSPQAKDDPSPTSWTLRFKRGKHTILLLAEPLTPFSSIKIDLLNILRERYPSGLSLSSSPTPTPIPDSINEVILGVPINPFEPEEGWTEMDTNVGDIKESPKSLGLKDGAVIAFAFIEEEEDGKAKLEFVVEWSSYEAEYGGDDGEGSLVSDEEKK
jgi:hypothetical protein